MTLDKRIRQSLGKCCIPSEYLDEVSDWVSRFCSNGQIVILSFLMYSQEAGRLEKGLAVLQEYWESDFQYQHPDVRGDLTLKRNIDVLALMHHEADIPVPKKPKALDNAILDTAFEDDAEYLIETRNSVYRLYPKDEAGERRIVREKGGTWEAQVTECYIEPKGNMFASYGQPDGRGLRTSAVRKVEKIVHEEVHELLAPTSL